jgi:hypothetical protein
MFRRLLSLPVLACLAASCVPSESAPNPDAEEEAGKESFVAVWNGLGLLGIHDPPYSQDLLDLFPKGGGFVLSTLYSTDFDWVGDLGSTTTWARQNGFSPILRVDYARADSTFADGSPALGATVPMPGDVGSCLARANKGVQEGPSRNAGGKHLDCYLAYIADVVPIVPDVHTWIIGNEMNMIAEAVGHPGGKIDPLWYSQVFRAAREKIQSYPGHDKDAVLVGAVSPNGASDKAYQSGKAYLSQLLYHLAPNQVDGIAMHAYGGWSRTCDNGGVPPLQLFEEGSGEDLGYRSQARWIDALGHSHTPLIITEMSAHLHVTHEAPNPACGDIKDGYLYDRKDLSDFIRAAYKGIHEWNQGPSNHDILGGIWFVYGHDGFPSESLRTMRKLIEDEELGSSPTDNPYYAFREIAANGTYPHGDPGGFGECSKSTEGTALRPDDAPYALVGKIRGSWESNGGLAVFGYPIQEAACQPDDHGRVLFSQYTQRARLEYHPELAGTSFEVSFGLLGRPLAEKSGVDPNAWSDTDAPHAADCEWIGADKNTGHYVCGAILNHWKSHGVNDPGLSAAERSLRLFGLPISEPVQQKGITVQWFERARLEHHPGNEPPNDVLGGLLGCEASGITGWGC